MKYKWIDCGINTILAAVITSQVQEAMEKQAITPVLIQLKTANIQATPNTGSRKISVVEMDSQAKSLVLQLNQHAQRTGKEIRTILDAKVELGIIKQYRFYSISNTFAVEATAELIEELSNQTQVEEISSNFAMLKANKIQAVKYNHIEWSGKEAHWSLDYIHATKLPSEVYEAAKNLRYGNADIGVQFDHPALASNYFGRKENGSIDHNYSWWDANIGNCRDTHKCYTKSEVPYDEHGHGSHTTGTAVGGLNLGVSPTSKWMACKNMHNNSGSPESYLGCLQFFLAPTDLKGENPKPDLRPHVVSNSYDCSLEEGCSKTTFESVLKAMKTAGIFMSVSTGNSGHNGCGSINLPPATDSNTFKVAATGYKNNLRAFFSSLGPIKGSYNHAIDIAAPGVNITSSVKNGAYASFQGTSMASPHVAGAVLLVTAACPHLTRQVDRITNLLHLSATPLPPELSCGGDSKYTIPNNETGFGLLNVTKAIELCRSLS